MTFKSAVDWWYYLIVVSAAALALFAVGPPLRSGELSLVVGVATIVLTLLLPVWLLVSTRYRIGTKSLQVRSGPFSWTIALADVQSIKPSKSLLSSPALSLKRLEIQYGRGKRILVSPEDPGAFINAIDRVATIRRTDA